MTSVRALDFIISSKGTMERSRCYNILVNADKRYAGWENGHKQGLSATSCVDYFTRSMLQLEVARSVS